MPMEAVRYNIKLFDRTLAQFDFVQDGPGAAYPCHLEIDTSTRHLLPMNLAAEPTDDELSRFLDTRRISKRRAYIEEVLACFGMTIGDTKAIIDLTKGASLNDSYLVTREGDETTFAECNLYDNDFDTVPQIAAYTGVVSEGALGVGLPSELTTSGSFPKAWRIVDGVRTLYKAGGISKVPEKALELDDLLAARRRYSGTFSTNLEEQLDFAMEDAQREMLSRLAGFEFTLPTAFAEYGQADPNAREAFTPHRLEALN